MAASTSGRCGQPQAATDRMHSRRVAARHGRKNSRQETCVTTYRIAVIPGDGIGKEVVPAGQRVLDAIAQRQRRFAFDFHEFGWGGDWYRRHGVMMPEDGLAQLL